MAPSLRTLGALALACLAEVSATKFELKDTYEKDNFFDKFEFFTGPDPTFGHVNYRSRTDAQKMGLIGREGKDVFMRPDTKSVLKGNEGRSSVRIESKKSYRHGLFIAQFSKVPTPTCGVWPAFWTYGEPWFGAGEVDIIEQWNNHEWNHPAIHTGKEEEYGACYLHQSDMTGSVLTDNCDNSFNNPPAQYTYQGCTVSDNNGPWGSRKEAGIYAMEWTSEVLKLYSFTPGNYPANIFSDTPDTATWGKPMMMVRNDKCDIDEHFAEQRLVLNIDFCGTPAGSDREWREVSKCDKKTGFDTCAAYVSAKPKDFKDAEFKIRDIRVFEEIVEEPEPTSSAVETSAEPTQSAEPTETEDAEPTETEDAEPTETDDAEPTETDDAEPTETDCDEEEEPTETQTSDPEEPTETDCDDEEEPTETQTSDPEEPTETECEEEPEETEGPEPTETEDDCEEEPEETEGPEPTETDDSSPTGTEDPEPTETEDDCEEDPTETEGPEPTETDDSSPTETEPTETEDDCEEEPTETDDSSPTGTETDGPGYTTSTVWTTTTYTITDCEPEVTECPGNGVVVTETIPAYTTVCPIDEDDSSPTDSYVSPPPKPTCVGDECEPEGPGSEPEVPCDGTECDSPGGPDVPCDGADCQSPEEPDVPCNGADCESPEEPEVPAPEPTLPCVGAGCPGTETSGSSPVVPTDCVGADCPPIEISSGFKVGVSLFSVVAAVLAL